MSVELSHDAGGRLARAFAAIDAANAEDPRQEVCEGVPQPVELLYGRRMSAMLERLVPEASEALRLAVRAQHLRRWTVPRSTYPEGKAGYHRWRTALKALHADMAAEILAGCGYGAGEIARVRLLIGKENLRHDPEAQALEDAACLVFVEHHLAAFAARHEPAQVVDILRKTWRKMSPAARAHAAKLAVPPGVGDLLRQATAAP